MHSIVVGVIFKVTMYNIFSLLLSPSGMYSTCLVLLSMFFHFLKRYRLLTERRLMSFSLLSMVFLVLFSHKFPQLVLPSHHDFSLHSSLILSIPPLTIPDLQHDCQVHLSFSLANSSIQGGSFLMLRPLITITPLDSMVFLLPFLFLGSWMTSGSSLMLLKGFRHLVLFLDVSSWAKHYSHVHDPMVSPTPHGAQVVVATTLAQEVVQEALVEENEI